MSDCHGITSDISSCKGMTLDEFIRSLKELDFDALKRTLKFCREREYYEWCSFIQKEITSRVNA